MAGRPKKYTAKEFEEAVDRYFRSILRTEVMTERVVHMIGGMPVEELCEIRNDDGEVMMRERWLRPPSMAGICLYLRIDRGTWANYANAKKSPRHAPICEWAKMRVECYLEEILSTSEKNARGAAINLERNFWRQTEKTEAAGEEKHVNLLAGMSMREKMDLIRRAAGAETADGEKTEY